LGLALVPSAIELLEISRDSRFGNHEAELKQITMDARCTQVGFSTCIRRISSRIFLVTLGRPDARDLQRQNSRKPARCQEATVSGLTRMRALAQPEYQRRSAIQNSRSR
jgi:hypothetical protein